MKLSNNFFHNYFNFYLFQDKKYLCIEAIDSPEQNLIQYFQICNDFIHKARLKNQNVLIHW